MTDPWRGLQPAFEWRASQTHLLDLTLNSTDTTLHVCAPPGSGKTLIGLELARRRGRRTIVFSPTTAVRDQWAESVTRFGADERFAATDLDHDAELLSLTYQMLANPGEADAELGLLGRRIWAEDLSRAGHDAAARMAAIERNDPAAARREIAGRVKRIRRSLADTAPGSTDWTRLLGERAERMIDRLIARGIGCVVLDECHHLLDWWALVIIALVERLRDADPSVTVIGLTATLPDPDSAFEALNYLRLLGDVDAELQLPALVAEGELAPWVNAVHYVEPTSGESAYLADLDERLARDLDHALTDDGFVEWAVRQVLAPVLDDLEGIAVNAEPSATGWNAFWDRDPIGAAALTGWWAARGMRRPAGFDPPADPGVYDVAAQITLCDLWMNDEHGASASQRLDLRRVLSRHGFAATSMGIVASRGPADLVAARSSAKAAGAARVAAIERGRRERCRVLVVTEVDAATTVPAEARRVLGEDVGMLARVLAALCAEPVVLDGGVVGVSGRGMWCDAFTAPMLCALMTGSGIAGAPFRERGTDIPAVVEIVGNAGPVRSSSALRFVREAMTSHGLGCLVSTRGLVGEGWDCPAINVLVDLSEATSPTSVLQLRGRAVRVDPHDQAKVASMWDVVVVHEAARAEWARLRRRHAHWWGIGGDGVLRMGAHGQSDAPSQAMIASENARSENRSADLDMIRSGWSRLDPGAGAIRVVTVRPRRRTTVRTRPRRWLWGATAAGSMSVAAGALGVVAAVFAPILAVPSGALLVGGAALGWRSRSTDRGAGNTAMALGEAVRDGLVGTGPVAARLDRAVVRAEADDDGALRLSIDADEAAAELWADQLAETLGPLGTPRWMMVVDEQMAWRVPSRVGATREAAEQFAESFTRRVPDARLVRAGSPEATRVVLAHHRLRPAEIRIGAQWR